MNVPVLYIAGAGRSGTTLLEMILGNRPSFFSVGELRYFWEYWQAGNWLCGCGEPLNGCPFWSKVHERLHTAGVDIDSMAAMAHRYNRTRNLFYIAWQRERFFPTAFVEATGRLYQAIQVESGAEVIVDSSKVPSHLFLLDYTREIDLRVLHLVRDGRAVAYSWSQQRKRELGQTGPTVQMPVKSSLKAMMVWLIENQFAARARQTVDYYTLMRYEDFGHLPDTSLAAALQTLKLPAPNLGYLRDCGFPIAATHSVGGNPLRFSQRTVTIRADEKWHQAMPRWQQLGLGFLVWPMLLAYGYSL
jgi:hypothetical protein